MYYCITFFNYRQWTDDDRSRATNAQNNYLAGSWYASVPKQVLTIQHIQRQLTLSKYHIVIAYVYSVMGKKPRMWEQVSIHCKNFRSACPVYF